MYHFIVVLILISVQLFSQELIKVEFDSDYLCWQDYYEIDSLDVYKQDFVTVQAPVNIGNRFLLSVKNSNAYNKEGYLVEFRKIDDGSMVWEKVEYSEEQFTRRYVNNFLVKDKVLELYLIEEGRHIENLTYPSWSEGHIALIRIDLYTGDVIEEIRTDHSDLDNSIHIASRYVKTYYSYDSSKFRKIDFVSSGSSIVDNTSSMWILFSTIDINGILVESDTITRTIPFVQNRSNNAWFDHQGRYSYVFGGRMQNDSLYVEVLLIDDFKIIKSVNITNFIQDNTEEKSLLSFRYTEDKLVVAIQNQFEPNVPSTGTCYLFTIGGELLNKKSISYNIADKERASVSVDMINDKIYMTKVYDKEDYTRFDILGFDDSGVCHTLASGKTPNENLAVFLMGTSYLGQGRFALTIRHRQPSIPPETPGVTGPIFSYIGLLDLNKVSSTAHEAAGDEL